ncbi:Hypothetical predicted protein [Mytilus galloprovincialis]|uniref:DZIP3-like HEPN domain-containing protein n=1 Tax=Mytilus galloprovincialis TaxID=29158 RepID=A0A8B6CDW4_MYTGA|nr:Hypothetical predicted protein [Mytilus galloprovincialis]
MVTKEEENFLRIVYLHYRVATGALTNFFDKLHPSLSADLNIPGNKAILQDLYIPPPRKKRVLYRGQWDTLYPPPGPTTVTSADLDLTLIVCLLRNIPPLVTEPPTGFDNLPPSHDKSDGANIARLKYYKNFLVSHSKDGKLSDADFVGIWNDLEQAIKGLDNSLATAASLKDAEKKLLDNSMVQMLSTHMQLVTKVSNFEEELKHISIHIDKDVQEKKQLKQITETLDGRMKIKEDSFEKEFKECKENVDRLSERLNTSEVQIYERVESIETCLGEIQKLQQSLDLQFTRIKTIAIESKKEKKDFEKDVQLLCSRIQVDITKHEERIAALENKSGTLQEIKKDVDSLKRKLEELMEEKKKRVEDQFSQNIRAQQIRVKEWEQDQTTFLETRATRHILEYLPLHNCIVVTGSSGCGKSSNIQQAALHLRDNFGYEIIPVLTGPTDIMNYYNKNKKQVFIVDDICGKDTINMQTLQTWRDYAERFEKMFKVAEKDVASKNDKTVSKVSSPKLLLSCRLHIYKEGQFQRITLFTKKECNLLSSALCLLEDERMHMLHKYLPHDIIDNIKQVTENVDYFPLLCKLSKDKTFEDVKKLFIAPLISIKKNINNIINENKEQFCALTLCIIFNDGFNTDWLTKGSVSDNKKNINNIINENKDPLCAFTSFISSKCRLIKDWLKLGSVSERKDDKLVNIVKEFDIDLYKEEHRNSLKSGFSTLNGTYLKLRGTEYRMIHDKIYKMAAVICGKHLTECFIKYAPPELIRDHFIFKSVTEVHEGDNSIALSTDQEKIYFERLLSDLKEHVMISTFHNYQLIYKTFRDKLISYLGRNDDAKTVLKKLDTHTTPLLESAITGYSDIVHFLIVNIKCNVNNTKRIDSLPLHKASAQGHSAVVKCLLENNADISQCNTSGESALYAACVGGHKDTVELLIQNKSDINQCNKKGESPLYQACTRGYNDIVELLLQKNADVNQCVDISCYHCRTPLLGACQGGHTDTVKLLLQKNADVSQCDQTGVSPLHMACLRGHTDTVELLHLHNVDVSQCYQHGVSPLYSACERGHTHIVELLLQNNGDVNQCNNQGKSPLNAACKWGHTNIVEMLLQKNADVSQCDKGGWSPLNAACKGGHKDTVELLLQKNADVSQCDEEGQSSLYVACEGGHKDTVEMLLQKNADVSQCDKDGWSPLNAACQAGHTHIVEMLLQKNADVSQCDNDGWSLLHAACQAGYTNIVEMLLQKNADVSQCDNDGWSSLHAACQAGYTNIVEMLLQKNADVSQFDNDGWSSLHAACQAGHTDIVELLLEKNADVCQCDKDGWSPMNAACDGGHTNIVEMLLQKNADVSQFDIDEWSLLHAACKAGYTDIVELLLQKNADVCQCDEDGRCPLYVACEGGHTDTVELLLQNNADVSQCDEKGQSPLYVACKGGYKNIVELLLQNNADVNKCNKN